MRTPLIAIILALALGLMESASAGDRFADIDDAVKASIERKELPGAVVVILHDNKVVYRKAFGHRSLRPEPTLMTEDTVFDLASLTKPIVTALCILLLEQDNKLDVNDFIAKILPAFARKETEGITIAHLLTHTGGFIADNSVDDYRMGKEKAWQNLFALKPLTPPGTRFVYSDVSYLLLGKIVETVSGMSLDEFAHKRIFEPLGMKDTGYRPQGELRKKCAPTEEREGRWMTGEVHDPRAFLLGGVAGHAGLFSTADDLTVFARMMLQRGKQPGTSPVRAETIARMTTPRKVEGPKGPGLRTYGWDMATAFSANRGETFPKGISYGHTGFTGTSIWIDPRSQTAVIFLSNRVHPDGKGNVSRLRSKVATIAARECLAR